MKTESGPQFRLENYKPTDFEIETVHLTFRLDPRETVVTSRLVVKRRGEAAADAPLVLNGDELELAGLKIDGENAESDAFDATVDRLEIRNLPHNAPVEIEIRTRLSPDTNSKLMGLYRSNGVYCTQCEAEGFRRITFFLDRPDVLSVYTTRLEARKAEAPLLLSNGNPGSSGAIDGEWHFAEWHDPHPKPSYLFAMVAGDLGVVEDDFVTHSGRSVDLKIFVEHGKEPLADYAMDSLKRSMRWDEERFGREYDLDIFMIVAVSDFNMGAMENKGLNIFNDKYVLADPETATDMDYANIEAIIAHEYFHNWTGNRITCRDWFQLCLKEGLTVYRDHEFSADMRSRPVKRIAEVRMLKAHQFPEDSGPLAHPVRPEQYSEINNFYTATVYEKGSEVIRMLATVLGSDGFKAGLDLYFDRHDGQAATVEDFLTCFEDATGTDLGQFSLWYKQAGTPAVTVTTRYDSSSQTLTAQFEQSLPATPGQKSKKPMHIPLRTALFGLDGEFEAPSSVIGADMTEDVLHLTQRRHEVTFSGLAQKPVLSLNRSFSAPINVHFRQASQDLAHLARFESDAFTRWQAINDFATRELIATAKSIREGGQPDCEPLLIKSLLETLDDDSLEPALRAHALTLPSEADIAREIGTNIDPEAIHTAREKLISAIATADAARFLRTIERFEPDGPFRPDAQDAGKRALFLVALRYVARSDGNARRVVAAHGKADNMTILSGTLNILAHDFADSDESGSALEAFRSRFADNHLVIDKWLAVQATVPGPDTLKRVRHLMTTDLYSGDNPNRIRALIGSFASANPTGFNQATGDGYAFLAEQVLALDKSNPQVAARLLTALRSWSSMEPNRREKARQALSMIAGQDALSTDVRDITDRMLA